MASQTGMGEDTSQRNTIMKEIEENNRMGKTREPFKKIVAIKGKFYARMGTVRTEVART